ncbi:hypothetical protein Syun_023121 [Stephania yunnanensis]|uniref:Endonuclease/exonuclease/phosphatase domain-containing protein n=1 Tax=Stephania yunnanensis TaxID=152371 RepID=A0AAP0F8B2_9MAGN
MVIFIFRLFMGAQWCRFGDNYGMYLALASSFNSPWILVGDFNALLWPEDKVGGTRPAAVCKRFRSFIERTGLSRASCFSLNSLGLEGSVTNFWTADLKKSSLEIRSGYKLLDQEEEQLDLEEEQLDLEEEELDLEESSPDLRKIESDC